MDHVERLLNEYSTGGMQTRLEIGGRTYTVFAYPSPGRDRTRVRWNLYEVDRLKPTKTRGLSFGVADGVREALEDVVQAAEAHAIGRRIPRTFRPSPMD